jgi:hypothetical protein
MTLPKVVSETTKRPHVAFFPDEAAEFINLNERADLSF